MGFIKITTRHNEEKFLAVESIITFNKPEKHDVSEDENEKDYRYSIRFQLTGNLTMEAYGTEEEIQEILSSIGSYSKGVLLGNMAHSLSERIEVIYDRLESVDDRLQSHSDKIEDLKNMIGQTPKI